MRVAEALSYVSVALFVERARAVDHRFTLTNENAAMVADICRHLDGIALAIELAAARVQMLSPKQLRDRLEERFRVLTSGGRDRLPRHRTLRALIDWSHDLLDERERRLFRRLSIFANGFTLEAASADVEAHRTILAREKMFGDRIRHHPLDGRRKPALPETASPARSSWTGVVDEGVPTGLRSKTASRRNSRVSTSRATTRSNREAA